MMREQTTQFGGLTISYATGPAIGAPLLLLHGVTRGWVDWSPILSSVTARWQVIAPDARGHGASSRTPGQYKVVDYIEDAADFVAKVLKEPALIWGHSLGAMVAAAVAAKSPDAVRGLFLEDPPYHTMGSRIAASSFHAVFKGFRSAALTGGTVDELARMIGDIVLPSPEMTQKLKDVRDAASIQLSARCLTRLDPEVLTPLIEGSWLDGHDYRDIFPCIKCPTLLVQADPAAGGAMSDDDATLAESLIARCHRVRLKGVGHQAHWADTPGLLGLFHSFAEFL